MTRINSKTRDYTNPLEAVMDTVIDGLITIDEMGVIQSFNPSAERIFGYRAEEVTGKNVKVLMPEPYHSEHDGYLRNYKETGIEKVIGIGREVRAQRKDGTIFPIELGMNVMNISGRRMFVGTVRDISDRKRAEEGLLRSNEELERYAYLASHDLQEPLRMVSSFTKLLDEEYAKDMDDTARQYMHFITDATIRMQVMVADLLDYARLGNEDAGYAVVDCRTQMDVVLENLREAIHETSAQVEIGPMPVLRTNPVRFVRLMQNLIGNALKYRAADRSPVIKVDARDEGDVWHFTVADNGIGMKEEYLEQIFIIFRRLHGKGEYGGTGIGLAACKRIVEKFGGTIWATSTPGVGSVFHFTLPKYTHEEGDV